MEDNDTLWSACNGGMGGKRRMVMAIVNVTPDSFYTGSRLGVTPGAIEARVAQAIEEGADILDVGGYSSRPGADDVTPQEELRRVRQAVGIIRTRHPDAIVSVDTCRASVAGAVLEEYGSCIVNDISAGTPDDGMVGLVARHGVPYIAMHMRGTPATMMQHTDYGDVVREVADFFRAKLEWLGGQGVGKVVVDPGFGFAKTAEQNHRLLAGLSELTVLGAPVLAGLSRKSMIYKVTGGTPEGSLPGTSALHWQALLGGARILRVHDVKAACDVIRLFEYYRTANGLTE